MPTPLTHVGQTAHPEHGLQQTSQQQPGTEQASQLESQQQCSDFSPMQQEAGSSQCSRETRQQHFGDGTDDPASDANTESANHPNDDE